MARLWRNNPDTPEGKYLVKRRDGTIPEWPWFVLGGADPVAAWAMRAYAVAGIFFGLDRAYLVDVWRMAGLYDAYRKVAGHRKGDPDSPRHRVDDPATVAEMKKGHSA